MNKSTKVVAAFCLLNSANIYALGIGEIETHSALNQMLKAQISLVGSKNEDPSNLIIKIASRENFNKAGIDRPHYLTQLKFTPVLGKDGEIRINVSSKATIKEPFVNFILEVEWPQGRTLKEFTILLDPPITMADVRATPLELPKSPIMTPTTPVTSTQVTTYIAPAVQQAPPKEYGPTKSKDTMWGIAKKLIETDHTVTHQQMILALYDNNPKAFYKNNINALKKGAILQEPTNEQLASRTITQANDDYREQIALWSSSTKTAPATTTITKVGSQTQQAARTEITQKKLENSIAETKLTLLTPKQKTPNDDVTVEGNSTDTPVGSTNPTEQANMAIEMAATLEEENKEVKSRLDDLETQVEKLQRLLALKDEQLAQLQAVKPTQAKPASQPTADDDSNLPLYGGILVLALLGLFLARRGKKEPSETSDLAFSPTPTPETPQIVEESNNEQADVAIEETVTESTVIEEKPLLDEFDFDFDLIKNEPLDEDEASEPDDSPVTDDAENDLDTKLALAQASIDMQDIESARDTLNEVISAGDDEQKEQAQNMLDKL